MSARDVGKRFRKDRRGVTTGAFRSALTMRHEPRRVARRKIAPRISGGDSGKKPGLASGDEPSGGCARKFFYCQKSRLRVRDDGLLPALISRNDIDRGSDAGCVNKGNACGTGVSCNIDNRRHRIFAHYSHRRGEVSWCCRGSRGARWRFRASTLP
jgi:hypothetical protein